MPRDGPQYDKKRDGDQDDANKIKDGEKISWTTALRVTMKNLQLQAVNEEPGHRRVNVNNLKSFESIACCFIWTVGVFYALYQFFLATNVHVNLDPNDFEEGWSVVNRRKDISDREWAILKDALDNRSFLCIIIIQLGFSQVLFTNNIKAQRLCYSTFPFACFLSIFGLKETFIYVTYVITMFTIHTSGKKIYCYLLTLGALLLLANKSFWIEKDDTQSFLFEVGFAWLIAKCLSFSIDRINLGLCKSTSIQDILMVTSYSFYLTTFFSGPIITYGKFDQQISAVKCWTKPIFLMGLLRIYYYCMWYLILEFMLHFFYSSSVQYQPDALSEFNTWALAGLGYCLPLLFFIKYYVIYGMAGSLARLDHFKFPPPPKCISCVHKSSNLWRHFDRGLYIFIVKYLYMPLIDHRYHAFKGKFLALIPSFTFVCVWHGMERAICIWCTLNFLLVISEMVAAKLNSTPIFHTLQLKMSVSTYKRLLAFIATPHFMLMCTSSVFFLANCDVGMLTIKNIIFGKNIYWPRSIECNCFTDLTFTECFTFYFRWLVAFLYNFLYNVLWVSNIHEL